MPHDHKPVAWFALYRKICTIGKRGGRGNGRRNNYEREGIRKYSHMIFHHYYFLLMVHYPPLPFSQAHIQDHLDIIRPYISTKQNWASIHTLKTPLQQISISWAAKHFGCVKHPFDGDVNDKVTRNAYERHYKRIQGHSRSSLHLFISLKSLI